MRRRPPDALHVTVTLFDHAIGSDGDATPASVEGIDETLRGVVADRDPFDVADPRLNLFPDAVYAEADADGAIGAPNRALCAPAWASTGDRDGEWFVPHLTPGSLVGDDDHDRLVDFLESNRDLAVPPATVTELSLVARDHAAGWRSSSTTLRPYSL